MRPVRDIEAVPRPSPVEAVKEAATRWVEIILAPILRAFEPAPKPDARLEPTDRAEGAFAQYDVFLGFAPMLGLGRPEELSVFGNHLIEHHPFHLVSGRLGPKLDASLFHWAAFHVSRDENATLEGFCVFDGEPWPDATQAFASLPWPPSGGFVGFKTFVVLRAVCKPGDAVMLGEDKWVKT